MKHILLFFTLLIASSNVAFSQYSVTFNVTDEDTGLPIENAQVTLDANFFESTDAAGQATFTDFANGTYTYSISAPCYEFISEEITVADGNVTQSIIMSAATTNSIVFFVGSPFTIEGTVVTVTGDDNYFQEITLTAFGLNSLENVPYGVYNYTIVAPCYEIVSGQVTVDCNNGDGVGVFEEPAALTTNSVFFFVGSPLNISGATVTVSGDNFFQEITTGAPFGDVMENVPYGEYSYSISAPCYDLLSGNFTVDCANGEGVAVFAEPVQSTTNSIFFFVGSPLTISGAVVNVEGNGFSQELVTGAPFGDMMADVPYGDYTYTITAECYETITGTVTVECANGEGNTVFAEPVAIEIDNSTTVSNSTIVANTIGFGYTYQWLDCDNDYAEINGATNVSYTATENGSYAVAITNQSCTVISECVDITQVGISNPLNTLNLSVFPNPFSDQIQLSGKELSGISSVQLFSVTSQLVYSQTVNNTNTFTLNVQDLPAGSYILRVNSGTKQAIQKLMKH
jgi:hypothetical protein